MLNVKVTEISTKYSAQMSKAKEKGVPWNLTIEDWIEAWKKSGKYHERGNLAEQYVLARIDKEVGFEIGNIHIVTNMENGKNKSERELKESSERGKINQELKKLKGENGTIVTPLGQYYSLRDAADALGVNHNTVAKRIKSGNEPGYYRIDKDGVTEAKETKRAYSKPVKRGVKTTLGNFKTAKDAALAHSCSPSTMKRWLDSGKDGFNYEDQ